MAEDWVAHVDPATSKTYYHNATTQETVWERPAALAPPPEEAEVEWVKHVLPCGKEYYEHTATEETSWTVPAGYHAAIAKRDWREREDPGSGELYYYNLRTQETSWEPPEGYAEAQLAKRDDGPPPEVTPRAGNPVAIFDTSVGSFEAEIYLDRVPVMASNFMDLAKKGFYNQTHVHRVTPGTMVWLGCPHSADLDHDSVGKGLPPVGPFQNLWTGETEERTDPGFIKEDRLDRTSNAAGCLAMVNAGRPGTTGSIFVISAVDNPDIDHFRKGAMKFPVFGKLLGAHSLALCRRLSEVAWTRSPAGHPRPEVPVRLSLISLRDGNTEAGVFRSAKDVYRAMAADSGPAAKKARVLPSPRMDDPWGPQYGRTPGGRT